ncbi:MAG: hypoxanthine phosphoribosyltransferase [Aestuariivirga sp.]|jgi:hypoxanthine phosphoribosyltransferase|nr:MAG: hypoxanthine phosphoribosyltransferase [Hyphomicrobiales bacterium]
MSEQIIEGHRIGVLFSESQIADRITELAREIAARKPERLLVVPVLKGSFIFAADLIRAMHHAGLSPEVDFMMLSSYRAATRSSGQVQVLRDIESDVKGRHVLLVDDILESGRTLAFAKDLISARGAARVYTAVLLNKPGHLAANIGADFECFKCPDKFVVGFGMDMAHQFRELPFVGHVLGPAG